jgi:hypothetical protein
MKTLGLLLVTLICVAVLSQPLIAATLPQSTENTKSTHRNHPVPHWFFQMETHGVRPWPSVPINGLRLWDTGTKWSDLNPSDGVYDWAQLDKWLSAAKEHGTTEILYTMGFTPQWASSNPGDTSCRYSLGACDPPEDLNPDGTGTDQHWKDFIRAIATHAAGRIGYWELWNEPAMSFYWNGTFPQLVRMAQDARTIILSIDPKAKLLSPPNGAQGPWVLKWWTNYATAGGLQYADIAAVHGGILSDCGNPPQAAEFITIVKNLRGILAAYNQGKPIWDTEANWGNWTKNCFTDQDLQAAFLAQFYFFHRSMEVVRLYWYSYSDPEDGTLYDTETGKLTKGGVAYQQVHDWMIEKTLRSCSANNTIWTCRFTDTHGYVGEAIWDTSQGCSHGSCQTLDYSVSKVFTHYRTLGGETIKIANGSVPIGAKPILLEK